MLTARIFDCHNPHWTESDEANRSWLAYVIGYYNDVLKTEGHVFLSELLEQMGYGKTFESITAGWVYGAYKTIDVKYSPESMSPNTYFIKIQCLNDIRKYFNEERDIYPYFSQLS